MAKVPSFSLRKEDIPQVEGIDNLIRAISQFANDTTVALSSSLTFKDNFFAEIVELDFTLVSDSTLITTVEPWGQSEAVGASNYYNPAFMRKTTDGHVFCVGILSGGLPGTVAFQLTKTLRPKKQVIGLGYGKFGSLEGPLAYEIFPTGEVRIGKGVAGNDICDFFHFNAAWPTEDLTPIANDVFPQKQRLSKISTQPLGVIVLKAVEINASTREEKSVGKSLNIDWTTSGNNLIIENIPGLIPSRRYKLKLLVFGS